ncbi:MAG: Uma2 family endonuclease [Gemmataceae bacterium]|nr:Uma2 family endonuclease [Gemmataceae bacterium]
MQPTVPTLAEPDKRRWTRSEFYRMAELGWFDGQRVELIDGDVMVQSPQKFGHYATVDRVAEVLRALFGAGFWVRIQGPMAFGAFSEPEPDVSVAAGRREDYSDHPTTAVLLVEVSDTTLAYDQNRKASLYATVGVREYWIVNLVDRQVEVYRNPRPDNTQDFGHGYADRQVLVAPAALAPLALPGATVQVADLLP